MSNMSKPIEITLFYANWCGHCNRFMPTWEQMKKDGKSNKNINFVEYEEAELEGLSDDVKSINGERINSYPSIKITINGKEHYYDGQRDSKSIYSYIKEKLESMMNNGSIDETTDNVSIGTMSDSDKPMKGGNNVNKINDIIKTCSPKLDDNELNVNTDAINAFSDVAKFN